MLIEGLDVDLTLNFLFKNAHTDPAVLKDIKTAIEGRSNVLHNATIVSHVRPSDASLRTALTARTAGVDASRHHARHLSA